MQIKMDGKYQTRDGRAVRILCVDGPNMDMPVAGFVTASAGNHPVALWSADGFLCTEGGSGYSLIPVLTKHEGWGLVKLSGSEFVEDTYTHLQDTEKDATWLLSTRLHPEQWHVVHVTWEN